MCSDRFRELEEGELIPTYTVIISTGKKAQRTRVKFKEDRQA
jgi:hypothetical protein